MSWQSLIALQPRDLLPHHQNYEPKLSADPRSTVFFKSTNPLDLSPKSTSRELFKAKSADPRTYSPPSIKQGPGPSANLDLPFKLVIFRLA